MRSLLGAAFLAAMLTSVAMSQNADLADAVSRTQEKLDDVQAKTGTIDKLMDAVRRNDAEGIKNVIAGATDADTEVKHISGDGKTLLHFAAIWPSGRAAVVDTVPELIAAGAELDATDFYGYTPIMLSASMGSPTVMKHLLAAGADLTYECTQGSFVGMTALDLAYEKGREEEIALLVAAGAPRGAGSEGSPTPVKGQLSDEEVESAELKGEL